MSRKASYFKIGVFVIVGFVIVVIGIVVFGAGKFFREKATIETYFDQSVQGLEVGAPLKFQGVQVGNVSEIAFVFNYYKTEQNYVLVRADIYPDKVGIRKIRDKILSYEERIALLQGLIEKGLRLELASQGITGLAFLNMVYKKPELIRPLPIDWKPEYFYVPSAPGTITLVTETIENLTQTIQTIDIKAITDKVDQLLRTTNQAVEDAQIAAVSQDIRRLVSSLENNSKSLNSILEGKEIQQSLKDFAMTMENVNAVSEELPRTMSELSRSINEINRFTLVQRQHLDAIFEDIKISSENLRELTDTAKRYPSWVLFGNPPVHLNEVKE
ncbi:MAG TPA: MlaD family protein [Thermodesulfobacteriota bacterium]|nr:MlaD family protein [Thermodesulfobacteriota bacterium]